MSIVETSTRPGVSIVRIRDDRWRITRRNGEVLGYIDRSTDAAGHPFHASRFRALHQRFVPVGDFWTLDDALDALS